MFLKCEGGWRVKLTPPHTPPPSHPSRKKLPSKGLDLLGLIKLKSKKGKHKKLKYYLKLS